jgi:hypothetical protein
MYKYSILESSNGYEIYVNLIESPAGKYLSRQPYVINLVREVLDKKKLSGPEVIIEQNMGRVIGNTEIVPTSEKDTIFYAQPFKKKVFSRYVKNRSMSPSTQLTIVIIKDEVGDYEITNAWIGPSSPPFPGDERATTTSRTYWETHALVADSQIIQSKTITKVCPY